MEGGGTMNNGRLGSGIHSASIQKRTRLAAHQIIYDIEADLKSVLPSFHQPRFSRPRNKFIAPPFTM